MTRRGIRTKAVAIGGAIATIAIAAVAFGYWTGPASGTATTTLHSSQALAVSRGSPDTQIAPGRSAAVLTIASNSNPYPVEISSISLDVGQGSSGFEVDGGHSGCVPTLDFSVQTNNDDGWTIPALVGSTPGSLSIEMPGALTMGIGASNACQGAAFTVYLEGAV
jgi:hypothetical protein